MPAYYIACDNQPAQNPSGNWNTCPVSESQIMTEQQVIDTYAQSNFMDTQTAYLVSGAMFSVCFFAWGFRVFIKQYNIGV